MQTGGFPRMSIYVKIANVFCGIILYALAIWSII